MEMLPGDIRTLFERCFVAGHDSPKLRPTAQEWQRALKRLDNNLQVCRNNGHHVFSGHMTQCPWCQRAAKLRGFDPFPLTEAQIPRAPVPVQLPRAAAAQVPQQQTRRKIAVPSASVVFYVLFVGVALAAISAWLAFNSRPGTKAGPPPPVAEVQEPEKFVIPEEDTEAETESVRNVEPAIKVFRHGRANTPQQSEPNVVMLDRNVGLPIPTVPEPTPTEAPPVVHNEPPPSPPQHREKYFAAKHKHRLIGGCDGVLTLSENGIRFKSEDHYFALTMDEVELDGDGITDGSGKNWHFSIKDMDVRELLRDWKDGRLEF
jgi:hypothetical protein